MFQLEIYLLIQFHLALESCKVDENKEVTIKILLVSMVDHRCPVGNKSTLLSYLFSMDLFYIVTTC